jgi:tetratricopeptide (TPR) repeat protein
MGKAGEQVGVRVVVVSPGDVARERAVAQSVVDELNRGVAAERRCRLSLWRWESDARPGMHLESPQGLIDELMDIRDADVVVGVLWRRFGTPTCEAASGTEHELRRAWAAWHERGRPEVMVYFCTRAYAPKTPDELAQWQRVLEFQRDLPSEQLSWRYESVGQFEALLREHLTRYLLRSVPAPAPRQGRAAGRGVRFNVPAVAASFTGRQEELDALDDALGVAGRAVVTQAITGLGGVGKSQLAARYVQQHGCGYDVVAWIRAEDGGIADLAQLAVKLGEPVAGLSPSDAAQLALDWLSDSEQRWLLVLDNVESPEQLDGLRPQAGSGRVLVTSRDRALRQFGPVLTVDVFDEDTATAYLTDRAGRPGDDRAARQLARALGCLPLALSHAAAYCQSGTSFIDYLELLGELPAHDLFDSHPELSYAQTVASTWKASIQAASADAPRAADALAMAAHLGPDAIPKSLFSVLSDTDTALGRKRLADALNALARFSLATVDDDSVSVHRLLQKVVRDDHAARDDQAAALHALTALHGACPDDVRLPSCWPWCEQLLPHGLALAETLKQPGDAGPQLIDLLNRVSCYLHHAEPGQRDLATAQVTLRHAEPLLGAEHPQTLTTREHLASAYLRIERIEQALAIFEPLLADRERILGLEHPDTLRTRNSVAVAYHDAGRVGEAIAIFEPLLGERERILGAEHPDTLSARHDLGFAYLAAGRVGEAIAIYEPLLGERERILGAEHPDTLWTRNNLARAYKNAGRTGEAIAMIEPLLDERQRILGAEHPDTLRTRDNLGRAYLDAGRVSEAIAMFEPLLDERQRILGAEHPDTLWTHDNLGRAYLDAGRVSEAIAILEPLLDERQRILGPGHPDTLWTRNNLGRAYLDAGRVAEAIAILEALLDERQRILGAEHPATLTSRHNLAHAYLAAGRVGEAIPIFEALLADRERILGAQHPDTLRTRNKLVAAYHASGRMNDVERVLKQAGAASS